MAMSSFVVPILSRSHAAGSRCCGIRTGTRGVPGVASWRRWRCGLLSMSRVDASLARQLALGPGHASAYHPNLIHGSLANRSGRPRRALAIRYRSAGPLRADRCGPDRC
jgi:ectoine hydroxylase-related dioxygenase (phytanoyl-CoA dioxygenase family)